jgi:hypothetical protein
MTDAIAKAITSMFLALADRPFWLVVVLIILVLGLAVRLALSNPAFWELMKGMMAHNTNLTEQTLSTVKLIADRQEGIKTTVEAHEDQLGKIIRDVAFLTSEVEILRGNACAKSPTCLNKVMFEEGKAA